MAFAAPFCAAGQSAQGHGGYRGPATEAPALTPQQKARLAELDALQHAIVRNDALALQRMIASGVRLDVNFDEAWRGRSSESPLTMAIGRGHLDIARILLDAGADPNRRDGFGNSAMDRAQSAEATELLARHGAQRAAAAPATVVSLRSLVDMGDAEAMRQRFANGANPSLDDGRETLLEHALFRKRWDIARMLVEAGAAMQPPDGAACAQSSMQCHTIEAARLATLDPPTLAFLKARGLDLDRVAANGHTALTSLAIAPPDMRVAGRRTDGSLTNVFEPPADLPRVRALLELGADPNQRYRAFTPLMVAVATPQKPREIADAIYESGGRVEYEATIAKPREGQKPGAYPLPATPATATAMLSEPLVDSNQGIGVGLTVGPLTWLAMHGRGDLAARVLARDRKIARADRFLPYFAAQTGAWDAVIEAAKHIRDVDSGDRAGVTPLMIAAQDGRVDAVQALLAAGAKVNARSDRDWPPIWDKSALAALSGHPSPPRLVGGYTALKAANEKGHAEVAAILREAGARE